MTHRANKAFIITLLCLASLSPSRSKAQDGSLSLSSEDIEEELDAREQHARFSQARRKAIDATIQELEQLQLLTIDIAKRGAPTPIGGGVKVDLEVSLKPELALYTILAERLIFLLQEEALAAASGSFHHTRGNLADGVEAIGRQLDKKRLPRHHARVMVYLDGIIFGFALPHSIDLGSRFPDPYKDQMTLYTEARSGALARIDELSVNELGTCKALATPVVCADCKLSREDVTFIGPYFYDKRSRGVPVKDSCSFERSITIPEKDLKELAGVQARWHYNPPSPYGRGHEEFYMHGLIPQVSTGECTRWDDTNQDFEPNPGEFVYQFTYRGNGYIADYLSRGEKGTIAYDTRGRIIYSGKRWEHDREPGTPIHEWGYYYANGAITSRASCGSRGCTGYNEEYALFDVSEKMGGRREREVFEGRARFPRARGAKKNAEVSENSPNPEALTAYKRSGETFVLDRGTSSEIPSGANKKALTQALTLAQEDAVRIKLYTRTGKAWDGTGAVVTFVDMYQYDDLGRLIFHTRYKTPDGDIPKKKDVSTTGFGYRGCSSWAARAHDPEKTKRKLAPPEPTEEPAEPTEPEEPATTTTTPAPEPIVIEEAPKQPSKAKAMAARAPGSRPLDYPEALALMREIRESASATNEEAAKEVAQANDLNPVRLLLLYQCKYEEGYASSPPCQHYRSTYPTLGIPEGDPGETN